VLSSAALVLLVMLGIVGKLTSKFQARHLIAFGWLGLALGMYVSWHWVNLYVSYGSATWVRILQYWPVGFLFVPLTLAGYVGLSSKQTNSASGLMNFMRNMGQSVGTSAVTTLLARRGQYHQSVLSAHTGQGSLEQSIQGLTAQLSRAGLNLYDAQQQALARMYQMVQAQTAALAYVDVYWLLAVTAVIMFAASFVLKGNKPGEGGNVSAH